MYEWLRTLVLLPEDIFQFSIIRNLRILGICLSPPLLPWHHRDRDLCTLSPVV